MSGWFGGPKFSSTKCKPQLKMAVHRFTLLTNKESNAMKKQKKEIAALLEGGKEELARIRTEHIIRGDFKLEAYDILSLHCEVLVERMTLIVSLKECPADLKESISTIMWAAPRVEVPELLQVHKMFVAKYGKDFASNAMANADGSVNQRVISKLGIQPPSSFLVLNYMKEIATAYNVNWEPQTPDDLVPGAPMPAPVGNDVKAGTHSGIGAGVYSDVAPGGKDADDGSATYIPRDFKPGDDDNDRNDGHGGGGGGGAIPIVVPIPQPLNNAGDVSSSLASAATVTNHAAAVSASEKMPVIPVPPLDIPTAVVEIPMPPSELPSVATVEIPMPPSGTPDAASATDTDLPSFDELSARFEALREKK